MSLGAFLAGLVVSESRFSHHAFGEIMPLQILFSATFFVSVGMLLDVGLSGPRTCRSCSRPSRFVFVVKAVTTAGSVLASGTAVRSPRRRPDPGTGRRVLVRSGSRRRRRRALAGGARRHRLAGAIAATVLLMVATPQLTALGAGSASVSRPPRTSRRSRPRRVPRRHRRTSRTSSTT